MKKIALIVILFSATIVAKANVFNVNNTNNSGSGSLAKAIADANANTGIDEITFSISGYGPHIIDISSSLPTITESIIIKGLTQPSTYNGDVSGRYTSIYITNSSKNLANCFNFSGSINTIDISGVNIGGFNGAAFNLDGVQITNLHIWECFIGSSSSGMSINEVDYGVRIVNSTIANMYIGTKGDNNTDWAESNLFVGNNLSAIYIEGATFTNTAQISYNTIGIYKDKSTLAGNCKNATQQTGAIHLKNTSNIIIGTNSDGVSDWAEGNTIGGTALSAFANANDKANGILLENCSNIRIAGNTIGVEEKGLAERANMGRGVQLNNCNNITLGYNNVVASNVSYTVTNVISGNKFGGVGILSSTNVKVSNNLIGTNIYARNSIPNGDATLQLGDGILVEGTCNNIALGLDGTGINDNSKYNYISNNYGNGICVKSSNVRISGNRIGIDVDGYAKGNAKNGIAIENASNIIVGNDRDDISPYIEHNYIGSNGLNGISVSNTTNISLSSNFIGYTIFNPNVNLANGANGIYFNNCSRVLVGSNANASQYIDFRNYIVNNTLDGIYGIELNDSYISNNFIGVSLDGAINLGNLKNGLHLVNSLRDTIGTNNDNVYDSYERNIISCNRENGIRIEGTGNITNDAHWISNNFVGVTSSGDFNMGNLHNGIFISDTRGTIIGTNGNGISDNGDKERNVIGYNGLDGIRLQNADLTSIANNFIGVTSSGQFNNANQGNGISATSCQNLIIGTNGNNTSDDDERNVISNNRLNGILLNQVNSAKIANNYIGTASWALENYGNTLNGILVKDSRSVTIGTDKNGVQDFVEKNIIGFSGNYGLLLEGSENSNIAHNYIGVSSDGETAIANSNGIGLNNSRVILIGTNADNTNDFNEANIISGNTNIGLHLTNGSENNEIIGNYIGIAKYGNIAKGNGGAAMLIENRAWANIIGARINYNNAAARKNIIANNGKGIIVKDAGTRHNRISANSFYNNGGPAIDINNDGVTPNDGIAAPALANYNLDYPIVVNYTVNSGNQVSLTGFSGTCNTAITNPGNTMQGIMNIELYKADDSPKDQDGFVASSGCATTLVYPHGEGRTYLGRITALDGVFNNTVLNALENVTVNDSITALTIDEYGNTSEFGPTIKFIILSDAAITWNLSDLQNGNLALQWKYGKNSQVQKYLIEYSTDGAHYKTISVVLQQPIYQYAAQIAKINAPIVYYRIKAVPVNTSSAVIYSSIKKQISQVEQLMVYPSLFTNSITIQQPTNTTLQYQLLQNNQVVKQGSINGIANQISGLDKFASGVYVLRIIQPTGVSVHQIIKQ
jgi:hypothetical protein